MDDRPFIVLVCGGRDYAGKVRLFRCLDELHELVGITTIVHGAAAGADSLGGKWAKDRGVTEHAYPADWLTHGRSAGPKRNASMLRDEHIDAVVACPGGRGTADMVHRAERKKIVVIFVDTVR